MAAHCWLATGGNILHSVASMVAVDIHHSDHTNGQNLATAHISAQCPPFVKYNYFLFTPFIHAKLGLSPPTRCLRCATDGLRYRQIAVRERWWTRERRVNERLVFIKKVNHVRKYYDVNCVNTWSFYLYLSV